MKIMCAMCKQVKKEKPKEEKVEKETLMDKIRELLQMIVDFFK